MRGAADCPAAKAADTQRRSLTSRARQRWDNVPRPSHARKDAAAAETFKSELAAELRKLDIETGRRVRIWVADEMRYGLQPVTRRVWSLRGDTGARAGGATL